MRRILFLVAVVAMAALAGVAAAQDTGLVAKGFKVGLAMYSFTGDDTEFEGLEPESRMGLAAGGFFTFALSPNFALQPEVLYVMKGAKYEEGGNKLTFKLDYLDIPVLFKYRFATAGSTRPNLFAGPVASLKMSDKLEAEVDGVEVEMDMPGDVKGVDFGLVLGGGLDFAMSSTTVVFDFRYTLGLTDWPDVDEGGEDVSVKNSGWIVALGVAF